MAGKTKKELLDEMEGQRVVFLEEVATQRAYFQGQIDRLIRVSNSKSEKVRELTNELAGEKYRVQALDGKVRQITEELAQTSGRLDEWRTYISPNRKAGS